MESIRRAVHDFRDAEQLGADREAACLHRFQIDPQAFERYGISKVPTFALVRAGAVFHKGKLLERPIDITPPEPAESNGTEVA